MHKVFIEKFYGIDIYLDKYDDSFFYEYDNHIKSDMTLSELKSRIYEEYKDVRKITNINAIYFINGEYMPIIIKGLNKDGSYIYVAKDKPNIKKTIKPFHHNLVYEDSPDNVLRICAVADLDAETFG